jgi:hypothetical protein
VSQLALAAAAALAAGGTSMLAASKAVELQKLGSQL